MTEVGAFNQVMPRAIGWSVGLGAVTGATVGVVSAMSYGSGWGVFGALAIAIPYGAAVGTIAGFIFEVPTALLTALIARWFRFWRVAGTAFATGMALTVVGSFLSGSGAMFGAGGIIFGAIAGVNSWIALPRVLTPGPRRSSQRF